MKTVRFSYNNRILNKDAELYINEPRRFKTLNININIKIEDMDKYMRVRYGNWYKYSEEFARLKAVVLDALINSPRFDEEGN